MSSLQTNMSCHDNDKMTARQNLRTGKCHRKDMMAFDFGESWETQVTTIDQRATFQVITVRCERTAVYKGQIS